MQVHNALELRRPYRGQPRTDEAFWRDGAVRLPHALEQHVKICGDDARATMRIARNLKDVSMWRGDPARRFEDGGNRFSHDVLGLQPVGVCVNETVFKQA